MIWHISLVALAVLWAIDRWENRRRFRALYGAIRFTMLKVFHIEDDDEDRRES